MLEDKLLIWKLRHGRADALKRIYQKYKSDMQALAGSLLHNASTAEDVVHDVFVKFAENASQFRLRSNLRAYLLVSVANRVRSIKRSKWEKVVCMEEFETIDAPQSGPESTAIKTEQYQRISEALGAISAEQREVIVLHLHSGLKFRAIADSLGVSINTAQSRYRYGIDKLRAMLDSEVKE